MPRRRSLADLPAHPLLVAAYPVVFLFAKNAAEQVSLQPIWTPLLLSIGAAAVTLGVLWVMLRDVDRAALLATVAVIAFFGYGHAWNAVGASLPAEWPFLIAWGVAVIVAVALIAKARLIAPTITRGLNVVAIIALLMNAGGVAGVMTAYGNVESGPTGDVTPVDLAPPDRDDLPDVYYIVLDRYAGPTALRETYGYDNEPFLAALEERGFRVARHAHANYVKTPLSLGSLLNLEMLDGEALKAEAESGRDRAPIQRRLSDHLAVPQAFKELGYRYAHIANWWGPTTTNVDADWVFGYEGQDEFSSTLLQTTLIRAFTGTEVTPTDPYDWDVLRAHTLFELRTLEQVPTLPGPKFVFAHILLPHPPWVIDADGSEMDRAQVAAQGDRESYVRFLRYGNERMLQAVDRIIAGSGEDAIIIIQGDEGPFPPEYEDDGWNFRWRDASDAQLEEKFGILFTMRVPGADLDAAGFTDDITSVNTFRVLFNARFGTDFPILPNRTYAHEDLDHFYDFFEITDRLDRG